MTLRFGFGFQIVCFKSDKGLSPDRHETHDVLKNLSAPKALHGGGDIHLQHPCDLAQQVWPQQVRTGAWYRELKSGGQDFQPTRVCGLPEFECRWVCAQVCVWVSIQRQRPSRRKLLKEKGEFQEQAPDLYPACKEYAAPVLLAESCTLTFFKK